MRIGYLVLLHQHPELSARLIRLLQASGGLVAVHYDLNCGNDPVDRLKSLLGDAAGDILWAKRTKVAWGDWSLVQATLNGLEAFERAGAEVDYVHLMSGADYPVRPISEFAAFLERNRGREFVEAVDISEQSWVRIGPEHERYRYYHHFNWRTRAWLSQKYWRWQQKLGLERRFPEGLRPHLGSQWWTLTWETCAKLLAAGRDPKLRRFFRAVAIPDEMFLQTVVAGRVDAHRLAGRSLTLSQFTDYGVPFVYHDDHADYLARQAFFFVRKISPNAGGLRDALDEVCRGARRLPAMREHLAGVKTGEYEAQRIASRSVLQRRRVMGRAADHSGGELEHMRPFVVLAGASDEELEFVRALLCSSGAVVCHGRLFEPGAITFASGERYAGYASTDTTLRDHDRGSFLAEVLRKAGDRPAGLMLPWRGEDGMLDKLAKLPGSRPLIVRGNVFRALLAHAPVVQDAPGQLSRGVLAGFYKEYRAYYDQLAGRFADHKRHNAEIVLTDADWLKRLNAFLDRLYEDFPRVRPPRVDEQHVAKLVSALSDPSDLILDARELANEIIEPRHRKGHLLAFDRRAAKETKAPAEQAPRRLRGIAAE